MIFEKPHTETIIFSDEKLSFSRKIMMGLLAVAIVSGAIGGYVQHNTMVKKTTQVNAVKTPHSGTIQQVRE
ncbi:MAG: hypothetical protein IJV75_02060 [Alphaproteobacteria bacterium]|nr:hypothetical protein [Alphaproteobacteria bacterium]